RAQARFTDTAKARAQPVHAQPEPVSEEPMLPPEAPPFTPEMMPHLTLAKPPFIPPELTASMPPWLARGLHLIRFVDKQFAPGQPAPPFTLPKVADDGELSLTSLRGQPVVLAFGSFTCNLLMDQMPKLQALHRVYGDRAAFVFVHVTEAGH